MNNDLIDYTLEDLTVYLNDDDIPFKQEKNVKKEFGTEWYNTFLEINLLNHYSGTDWRIGLQDTIETTWTSYNEDPLSSLTVNGYDSQKPWLPISSESTPNNETLFTVKVTYDSFDSYGNLLQKTTQALNPKYLDEPTLVTQYEYKTTDNYRARFLTKTTNIRDGVSYEENFEYDTKLGLKVKDIDINNLTTRYYYNEFGNLVKTVYPGGNQQKTVLRWSDNHPDEPTDAIFIHGLAPPVIRQYYLSLIKGAMSCVLSVKVLTAKRYIQKQHITMMD